MELPDLRKTLYAESLKLELGYLAGKYELGGLLVHEYARMEFLILECQQFYGGDERAILKDALTSYSLKQFQTLLKGAIPDGLQVPNDHK